MLFPLIFLCLLLDPRGESVIAFYQFHHFYDKLFYFFYQHMVAHVTTTDRHQLTLVLTCTVNKLYCIDDAPMNIYFLHVSLKSAETDLKAVKSTLEPQKKHHIDNAHSVYT